MADAEALRIEKELLEKMIEIQEHALKDRVSEYVYVLDTQGFRDRLTEVNHQLKAMESDG